MVSEVVLDDTYALYFIEEEDDYVGCHGYFEQAVPF